MLIIRSRILSLVAIGRLFPDDRTSAIANHSSNSPRRLRWLAFSLAFVMVASGAASREFARPLLAQPTSPLASQPPATNAPFPPVSQPNFNDFGSPLRTYAGDTPMQPIWPRLAQRTNDSPVRLPQDESSYPDFLPDAIEDDQLLIGGPKLTSYKSGFFQKLSVSGTWLPGTGSNHLGIVESEAFVTVALPAPTTEWPMLITPYLNIRSLDGPTTPDLPANLYEAYVDFMWVPRINERWIGIIAVTPSVYSDFDGDHPDAFRWQGKGMARWDIVPDQLQLLFGILYLNRENIRTLPAGGLIWKPNADMNYELVFPRPKLSHRLRFGDTWEDWIYVAGEFGGNSFAIRRADGSEDMATLRDWRVMLGVERKRDGGAGQRLEFGYIFSRQVEYRSATPDYEPNDTLMLRLVVMF